MISLIPPVIEDLFLKIKKRAVATRVSDISEEEQSISPSFAEETELTPVECSDSFEPVEVQTTEDEIVLEAFLDGVQRTVMLPYRIPLPNGALVPLHVAHIAAGVILRDRGSGRLYMQSDLIAARLLLLGPFQGIEEAGGGGDWVSDEMILDTSSQTFDVPSEPNEWIVCDTTFRGTDEDRKERREGALTDAELFKEGLIRSRAQGRVATLRQRLEFAVLAEFRAQCPEAWILVDGPLFFLDKWRRRAAKVLGPMLGESREGPFEGTLLKKSIGLIKTHRLRPKHPDQVLRIGLNQRSPVVRISQEVDIKGRKDMPDEEGGYGGAHLIWYTRLRGRAQPPYGLQGLVRLDVHRSTFGIERVDALGPKEFKAYRPLADAITRAVWKERWPGIRRIEDLRGATQVYPIDQLEKALKARVYPRRLLAHLLTEK